MSYLKSTSLLFQDQFHLSRNNLVKFVIQIRSIHIAGRGDHLQYPLSQLRGGADQISVLRLEMLHAFQQLGPEVGGE